MGGIKGKRVLKACEGCGLVIKLTPSKAAEWRNCSMKCSMRARMAKTPRRLCRVCGQRISPRRNCLVKCCSQECFRKMRMGRTAFRRWIARMMKTAPAGCTWCRRLIFDLSLRRRFCSVSCQRKHHYRATYATHKIEQRRRYQPVPSFCVLCGNRTEHGVARYCRNCKAELGNKDGMSTLYKALVGGTSLSIEELPKDYVEAVIELRKFNKEASRDRYKSQRPTTPQPERIEGHSVR